MVIRLEFFVLIYKGLLHYCIQMSYFWLISEWTGKEFAHKFWWERKPFNLNMYEYIIKKIVALVLNLKFLGTDDNDGEYCTVQLCEFRCYQTLKIEMSLIQ